MPEPPQLAIGPADTSVKAAALVRNHNRRRLSPAEIMTKASNPNGMIAAAMRARVVRSEAMLEATLIVRVRVCGVVEPPLKDNDPLGGLNEQLINGGNVPQLIVIVPLKPSGVTVIVVLADWPAASCMTEGFATIP
jgi:hypothetical protein